MGRWPIRRIVQAVVGRGLPAGSVSTLLSFGNTAGQTSNAAVAAYLRDNHAAVGDPVFIGFSEGACDALNLARDVGATCVVGIIPLIDLDEVRDGDLGGHRANIDAAWDVTYPDPLPAGASPADHAAEYAGIPGQLWGASDDTITTAAAATAFATVAGWEYNDLGELGHTNDAIAAVDEDAVASFVLTSLGI
jgi:hypothetical protein